jgi:hypothetical protein
MSIDDWLERRCGDGRLFEVRPTFDGDEFLRQLWVSPEIWNLINGPWTTREQETRCAALRADVEAFISGAVVTICSRPYEARDAFLGYLNSESGGVWDLRSRDPRPGIRLLGQFVGRNKFVALIPASRSRKIPYIQRGPLNDGDSPEWREAIKECEGLFRRLFYPMEAIKGGVIGDVLNEPYNQE